MSDVIAVPSSPQRVSRRHTAEARALSAQLFSARCRLGLTQRQFAAMFGLSYGSVRDVEQARCLSPQPAMRLAISAIDLDADLMRRAAQNSGGLK